MRSALFTALALVLLGGPALRADDSSDFFNGKTFDGWEGLISDYWTVQDGAIVGKTNGLKFNTFLCSKKLYSDFELSFKVKMIGGNSGVQIRSKIANPKTFAVSGPQADMGIGYWGSLYGELFGGMMKQSDGKLVKEHVKDKEFNDYSIKAVGKHITIKINGVTFVDGDFEKAPPEGIIAFQLHAGGPMEITFKELKFTNLKK